MSRVKTINWMDSISDDTLISQLSLPGSHDSCALHDPSYKGIKVPLSFHTAQCQVLYIFQQLQIGTRVLDIRLKKVNNRLEAYHGFVPQKVYFTGDDDTNITNNCYDFLRQNKSEVIFMFIKKEDGGENFGDLIKKAINANPKYWYTGKTMPTTLKEIRGKIVLLSRCSFLNIGVDFSSGWKTNNAAFTIDTGGCSFDIQDKFKLSGDKSEAPKYKWEDVKQTFTASTKNKAEKKIFINFSSGYYPTDMVIRKDVPNISVIADYVNPKISDYLEENRHITTGFLMRDFVDVDTNQLIIKQNLK